MAALVRYEQARTALAECARIDEASEIRDKAAALAAYARQRDDRDLEVWVREIHLRACVRIGELSRDLDQAQTVRQAEGATVRLPAGGKSKAAALADAGISTSTAQRYEELAGGREEQAQAVGRAAMEAYFTRSRAEGVPPTMPGLRSAVRDAVQATLGSPPPRPKRPSPPPEQPKVAPIGADWVDWTGAVQDLARLDCDLPELAARSAALMPTLLREALQAAERLRIWINLLEPTNDQAH